MPMGAPSNKERKRDSITQLHDSISKTHILKRLLLVLILATILFTPILYIMGGRLSFILSGVNAIVFSILYLLLYRGFLNLVSYGLSLFLLFSAGAALYYGGGIHDVGILLFPGLLLISSLLLPSKAYWVYATSALLVISTIGLAEFFGYKEVNLSDLSGNRDIPIIIFLIGLSAFFYRQFTQRIIQSNRKSYTHAKNYHTIFNSVEDAIVILNSKTYEILDTNLAYARLGNTSPDELIGQSIVKILQINGQFEESEAESYIQKTLLEGPQVFQWHVRLINGEYRWLSISLKAAEVFGKECIIAVLRDIDKQERMARTVEQDDKLKALGQLAGGVAHDFNNQLMGIRGYAELLQNQTQDQTQQLYLDMIEKAVIRASDLTSKLLSFARKGISRKEKVSLNLIVKETFHLLSRSIDQRISMDIQLPEFPSYIIGDAGQLQNVLLNLAINSRDAIENRGRIQMSLEEISKSSNKLPAKLRNKADYYVLEIKDTGIGIDPENLSRIFDPFFTTKEQGKGTGLGLSAVIGTMEMHNGTVTCKSTPGVGTSFFLFFPKFTDTILRDDDPLHTPD